MPTKRHNISPAPLEVWKFGGASLADAGAIERAATLIASHDGPLVVVASALAGIVPILEFPFCYPLGTGFVCLLDEKLFATNGGAQTTTK